MSGITHLHLDHTNIGTAEVKNNQGKFLNFDFRWSQRSGPNGEGQGGTIFFTLMVEEVQFLLNNPPFLPWFDDGNRCIRVCGDGIYIAPTYRAMNGGYEQTVRIVMRHVELFPILKAALDLPEGTSIEFSQEIRRSADMAKPKMEEKWDENALEVLNAHREALTNCLDRVRAIARNSSNGQDDPVTAYFYKDGDRSLYWHISHDISGRREMNGGIIWHGDDEKGEYSIHT